jgi:hypothetical protein
MTTVTRTYKVDDVDGSDEDVSTVLLALDKISYEIDLSATNEARLREKMERFVAAATIVKPRQPRRPVPRKQVKAARPDREQSVAVREWARNQGLKVSERGRISKEVQAAFAAAR